MSSWLLTEIRAGDGAQLYENPAAPVEHQRVIWLCGIDRASGVKVGERYLLEYQSTPGRGRFIVREPVWPIYGSAANARCFSCGGPLTLVKDSGNAPGHGQFSGYCEASDMTTFFDLTNGS